MMFRFLIPGMYTALVLLFTGFYILGAGGHGWNPFGFAYYLAYPAAFVLDIIPRSWGPENIFVLLLLFFVVGLIQWALIGYAFDRLVKWRRVKRATKP